MNRYCVCVTKGLPMVFICLFWMRKVKLAYIPFSSGLFAFIIVLINVRKSMCVENKRWTAEFFRTDEW